MRQGNGRGDLLGSAVGGYRLERLLGEDGSATVYLGALVEQARAGLCLPAQAQITVYPVPPTLPAEEQVAARARFERAVATAYAAKTGCGVATDFSKCPLVTLTTTPDSQSVARANAARRMWLKAMPHYPILVATDDFNTLSDFVSNGSAQFWEVAWIGEYPDPQDWLSTNLGCYGGYNDGNARDSTADTLMNTADESPDQATRLRDYQRAEQLMVTAVGWIPLSQATTWWETRPTVHNYAVSPASLIPNDTWQTIYLTAK